MTEHAGDLDRAPGQLLSLREARARLAGIGHTSIYRLINAGALPTIRIGRRRFVDERDLERFIAERREVAAATESPEMREAGFPASDLSPTTNVDGQASKAD